MAYLSHFYIVYDIFIKEICRTQSNKNIEFLQPSDSLFGRKQASLIGVFILGLG